MIPVYQPWIASLEKKYINDAVESQWISSTGKYVDKAEELLAEFIGTKYALTTTSGTTALHLCFRALDKEIFGPNKVFHDKCVLIPTTTFVASAFAAAYDNRLIKFVDINPETWNMDLNQVEQICKTHRVGQVMPVHLYGNPCDMSKLKNLQQVYGFDIIEDACESLGATIHGYKTGSMADIACFSFYGNKTFSCGEGGALTTNSSELYEKAKLLRGQAQSFNKRYWHVDLGYNYRLTNLQSAILCAQLERSDEILEQKQRVAQRYRENLKNFIWQRILPGHDHSHWLITIKLPCNYGPIANYLKQNKIDSRKVFYPITDMPSFKDNFEYPNASELSEYGLSLPSFPELSNDQIDFICDKLKEAINQ